MKVTLMTTTYNWKEALSAVLQSAFNQTQLPDEIIIGDDGSRGDTLEVVKEFQKQSPVPLKHIWQEDDGFQLSKIRNKVIAAAEGDYIIMVDGDMVLSPTFIEDHIEAAEEGCFVQGGRVITGPSVKDVLLTNPKTKLSFFTPDIRNRKNAIRSTVLSKIASGYSDRITSIRTCNFAVWKKDAIRVNGFNESFVGWGREDTEFVIRLRNTGVKRKNLKHKAIAYHLYHPENSRDNLLKNDELLNKTIQDKIVRCSKGIDQYITG